MSGDGTAGLPAPSSGRGLAGLVGPGAVRVPRGRRAGAGDVEAPPNEWLAVPAPVRQHLGLDEAVPAPSPETNDAIVPARA